MSSKISFGVRLYNDWRTAKKFTKGVDGLVA
jgi:hypothetical protein